MNDFSYQLYSSRNFPPLSDTLTMVAGVGYTAVEGYDALYGNAKLVDELKAHLDASGLTMPTGHFGLDMLESEPQRVLQIADELGIETLYCPYLVPEQRPQDRVGYVAFGQRLGRAAKRYRDAGLGFGWHNHDFEFQPLPDGTVPFDAIIEGGPALEWEADIAWIIRGGADPFAWIDRFGDRITAVHIKDIAAEGQATDEDGWADVGHGTVDWKGLIDALAKTPCKHFVMEHDNPNDAARFAKRSIETARTF